MDALGRLRAAIGEISDPRLVMERVVDQALVLIASADGAVVELVDGQQLVYACAAGNLSEHVGLRLAIGGSLSGLAVRTGETLYCRDSAVDARVDAQACRAVGAVSMVCVPLRREGAWIGVLKVSASRAGAFSDQDVAVLGRLAEFISIAISAVSELSRVAAELLGASGLPREERSSEPGGGHAEADEVASRRGIGEFVANVLSPGMAGDLAARRRIERVLAEHGYRMLCQPIVELASGTVVGVEALARFSGPPAQPPDVWFTEADAAGLGVALQLATVKAALGLLGKLRAPEFLAINVSAEAIAARGMRELLSAGVCERVVLELTEHLRVDDYPQLRGVLQELRERGVRLAIDDTGAGFSSLAHIVHLAPDLIKLDRQFTRGIDIDPVRRALATSLVSFARDTGAEVVAEGVETADELEAIRELGVPLAQGYFIARPAPLASLPQRLLHIARRAEGRAV
jgi:EAL domain-containing protein (putative c-di-GMP-specific phosphodiesterase class I)/putative methionine-R-sulfoxide reductase with GAF domain